MNPKAKKMKESSRIKFKMEPEGAPNTYCAQLELKVSSPSRRTAQRMKTKFQKWIFSLQNYKAKDSGTYICNIKNEAGEANVELTLNIEGTCVSYSTLMPAVLQDIPLSSLLSWFPLDVSFCNANK